VYAYETTLISDREAQRVAAAFYRFLEMHLAMPVEEASMKIQPTGAGQRVVIRMWSDDALDAFARHVDGFSLAPRKPERELRY